MGRLKFLFSPIRSYGGEIDRVREKERVWQGRFVVVCSRRRRRRRRFDQNRDEEITDEPIDKSLYGVD